ncbi:MAG TPA: DUF3499 family protein [Actinomycetota bacterium]
MRACAKMRCGEPAAATVSLRYRDRVVVVNELLAEGDPSLIDLCEGHAGSLRPPLGWERLDERLEARRAG